MRLTALPFAIALGASASCSRVASDQPPYLTTKTPLNIDGTVLCFAVDPRDRHGIWLWAPGRNGCASRSSGPDALKAEDASVSIAGDVVEARFRLEMIRRPDDPRPAIDAVQLILANGEFKAIPSGARAPIVRRVDLDIPETSRDQRPRLESSRQSPSCEDLPRASVTPFL